LIGQQGLAFLALFQLRLALGVLDLSNGFGTANTALTYHNGKLLALSESDKPYLVQMHDDGDLETIGRYDYDQKLNHAFTAHPKIDPDTGEMFTFGYQADAHPYVTYRVISKDGVIGDPVSITPSGPIMMHDFAITKNYAIFMDCPLYFSPKDMVRKNRDPFAFDETKPTRFGVLPRYAKNESQIRWFEFSTCVIFHNANAWEEEDEVVMISCRSPSLDLEAISVYDKDKAEAFVHDL
jgi:carotenoid cleavage dioxygenase-like enzyme